MVDYIGIADIQRLVSEIGTSTFIERLAQEIESDFKRWNEFDKSPRLASHSSDGVIELMPISNGQSYSFKYVNGHPKNTALGLLTVTAFGVLADARRLDMVPRDTPSCLAKVAVLVRAAMRKRANS
jgi:ornithine cyclodeaminase